VPSEVNDQVNAIRVSFWIKKSTADEVSARNTKLTTGMSSFLFTISREWWTRVICSFSTRVM